MVRFSKMAWVLSLLFFLSSVPVVAASTRPASPIMLSDISHSVDSILGPPDRTEVAIGESASFWVSTEDIDEVLAGESWVEVPDYVEVTWSSSGGGATVYPVVGEYTSVYFDLSANDELITIIAEATNVPGAVAADPVIQRQVAMAKKVPTAINVIGILEDFSGDPDPIPFTEDGNGGVIGAATAFKLQVQPTNVEFHKIEFREKIKAQNFPSPRGPTDPFTYPAKTLKWYPEITFEEINGVTTVVPNSSYDRITDFRVKEYLKTPAGVWKDATVELKVPYEFDTGNPIPLFKW